MRPAFTYVEIRSDGTDALPPDQLETIADHVIDLVDRVTGGPDATVWPTGDEQGFAWRHGFGHRPRAQALALLRSQLVRRTYIDDAPVFPRTTFGSWEVEVLHPSPPGSSSAWGLSLSGPTAADAALNELTSPALTVTTAATPPTLDWRLHLDGPSRAAKTWPARIGEQVGDVGTRLWCDPALMTATGAVSIAGLYAHVAAATRTRTGERARRSWPVWGPQARLRGASVRVDLAVPQGHPSSRQALADLAARPDARHGGCLTLQASPRRQHGRRFGWDTSGHATTLDEWAADIAGVPSHLRLRERSSTSTGSWRWLQIGPAPAAAPGRT